jgi:Flp pilus assembly secretin CpaC
MTRQSETAGFGPRPRWRRFHQGALALAVAAPLAGSAVLVAAALAPASAQTRMVEIGENKVGGVRVTQGKSQTLQTTLGFVDLVVGDPEIADVMPLTDRTMYVLGKKLGTTNVSVYDLCSARPPSRRRRPTSRSSSRRAS